MNRSEQNSHQITLMLRQWSGGNSEASEKLLPLVYEELHKQAAQYLRRERDNHTLQASALINEAYLKLIDQREVNWESRTHFFVIATQAMRRILVDHAKIKHRQKRGGNDVKISLENIELISADENLTDLIALDEALTRLEKKDKQQVRVVESRYFSGLSL